MYMIVGGGEELSGISCLRRQWVVVNGDVTFKDTHAHTRYSLYTMPFVAHRVYTTSHDKTLTGRTVVRRLMKDTNTKYMNAEADIVM